MKGLQDASLPFVPPGITAYGVAKGNTVAFFFYTNRNKTNKCQGNVLKFGKGFIFVDINELSVTLKTD